MAPMLRDCKICLKGSICPVQKKKFSGECYADSPEIYEEVTQNRRMADDGFSRMLEAERRYLMQRAMTLMRNDTDAEDLVQETMMRAYRARDTFKPGSKMRAWLFRIQMNVFLNDRRKETQNPAYGFSPMDDDQALDALAIDVDDRNQNPDRLFFQSHISDHIKTALDKTPEKQRVPFLMYSLQQYEYHEIAEMLRIPVGSVKSRIFRLRENLRESLVAVEA